MRGCVHYYVHAVWLHYGCWAELVSPPALRLLAVCHLDRCSAGFEVAKLCGLQAVAFDGIVLVGLELDLMPLLLL